MRSIYAPLNLQEVNQSLVILVSRLIWSSLSIEEVGKPLEILE